MTTKARQVLTVFFDIPKIRVCVPIVANTFEEALAAARELKTINILHSDGIEYTDYEPAEISGIYKV